MTGSSSVTCSGTAMREEDGLSTCTDGLDVVAETVRRFKSLCAGAGDAGGEVTEAGEADDDETLGAGEEEEAVNLGSPLLDACL